MLNSLVGFHSAIFSPFRRNHQDITALQARKQLSCTSVQALPPSTSQGHRSHFAVAQTPALSRGRHRSSLATSRARHRRSAFLKQPHTVISSSSALLLQAERGFPSRTLLIHQPQSGAELPQCPQAAPALGSPSRPELGAHQQPRVTATAASLETRGSGSRSSTPNKPAPYLAKQNIRSPFSLLHATAHPL